MFFAKRNASSQIPDYLRYNGKTIELIDLELNK
jgi:hypothetical protein